MMSHDRKCTEAYVGLRFIYFSIFCVLNSKILKPIFYNLTLTLTLILTLTLTLTLTLKVWTVLGATGK